MKSSGPGIDPLSLPLKQKYAISSFSWANICHPKQENQVITNGVEGKGMEMVVDSDADDEGEVEGAGDQVERFNLVFWCGAP